ncbi:uncharacterized protein LTR77_005636 [Saxophila tyrrhenica]|uniref:Myb-like domain-containing protein n=1 Tax=Saxophila tyrrhenica TaxID=1690608 RepID=A0AAV9PCI8_9PEZI|nr:hypothetical protein LTR77_005636 [Saxophila tyrrhenica]
MAKLSSVPPEEGRAQEGPQRTTRATRSMSKEPSMPPTLQKARGGAKKGGRKAKRVANSVENADHDLPTVDEDAGPEEELPQEPTIGEDIPSAVNTDRTRQESVLSGFSGTTVNTTFSQEEIEDMDRDTILYHLPRLLTTADDLVTLLVPADPRSRPVVRQEIRDKGTRLNKLYNNRVRSLGIDKESFGTTAYIAPSRVVRALLQVQDVQDIPEELWRPDCLIYKINLSTMLRTLLVDITDQQANLEQRNQLEDLQTSFDSTIAGPRLGDRDLQYLLSLLRQIAIVQLCYLSPDQPFNPRKRIENVFYGPNEDATWTFKHQSAVDKMGLSEEEKIGCANFIQSVASELIDHFKGGPATLNSNIDQLKAKYPWEQFVDETIEYFLGRKQELDDQIADVGGAEQVVTALGAEVERRLAEKDAQAKRESLPYPAPAPKSTAAKDKEEDAKKKKAMKALFMRSKALSNHDAAMQDLRGSAAAALETAAATAPVAQMTDPALIEHNAPVGDDWQPLQSNDYAVPASEPAQPAARSYLADLAGLKEDQKRKSTKRKGKSLLDRQEGAQRVAFNDPGQSQFSEYAPPPNLQYTAPPSHAQGPYYPSSSRASNKRPYEAAEEDEPEAFDPSQDQGFEVDNRNLAAADQRRLEAPQPAHLQQRHPAQLPVREPSIAAASRASHSPSKSQRRNPGSSIPAPLIIDPVNFDQQLTPEEGYQRAKIAARHNTLVAAQSKSKEPQARRPWNQHEEEALIDYIVLGSDDGISYSKIKSLDRSRLDGPRLDGRSAEDIRFKARNMKEVFMRARQELPKNFNYIVLDRKAIDKLRRLGVEYEQPRIRGGRGVVDLNQVEIEEPEVDGRLEEMNG